MTRLSRPGEPSPLPAGGVIDVRPMVSCWCPLAGAPRRVLPWGWGGSGGSPSALALAPSPPPPPPAGLARPSRSLPLLSLVAGTGTGLGQLFTLPTVSEGPRGRTSAALSRSSADVLHEFGEPPTWGRGEGAMEQYLCDI